MAVQTKAGGRSRAIWRKRKLEGLLASEVILATYVFLLVYQKVLGISVPRLDLKVLLAVPLLPLLVHYLIVKSDPLQKSHMRLRAVRCFQSEYPSKYLLRRCEACGKTEGDCPSYVTEKSRRHARYWLNDIFHGPIEQESPHLIEETFDKSYTCRVVCYTEWLLVSLTALGLLMIVFELSKWVWIGGDQPFAANYEWMLPVASAGVLLLLRFLHRPDEDDPTGCWLSWREINQGHINWLRNHEPFLKELICKTGDQ